MRKNSFEINDVIGNVIGNWFYDQIVQQDKKESAIIERMERIEALLIQIAADRTLQSHVSKKTEANGQELGT